MAVTGAIVCTPSSLTLPFGNSSGPSAAAGAPAGRPLASGGVPYVDCALTLTNGGSVDVQILSCDPYIGIGTKPAPGNIGAPFVSQGAAVNIPASSGTLVLHFGFVPFMPAFAADGHAGTYSTLTYTIGAFCRFSDGTTALSSTATLVVTAPAAP